MSECNFKFENEKNENEKNEKNENKKFRQSIQNITNSVENLLVIKNKKYGNSFDKTRDKYGAIAFALRLEDKFNRIFSLIKENDNGTDDESIEDTIKDIIGYCILELSYRNSNNERKTQKIVDSIL